MTESEYLLSVEEFDKLFYEALYSFTDDNLYFRLSKFGKATTDDKPKRER